MRTKAKRDRNEAAIVDALRKAGIGVYRLNDPGAPDLLCWQAAKPITGTRLLEVKSDHGRLTTRQRGYHGPRWIVQTPEDALAVFGITA